MNQTPPPVKLGVVGLGSFGKLHAQTIAGLAESQLTAIVALRQESIDETQKLLPEGQNIKGYLQLDRAMGEADVDGWVVASSTSSHVSITEALLQSGKPVLLEKPISEDLEEAARLAPFVKDDSSNLMLGHVVLFNSEYCELRRQIAQRGPIWYANATRHRPTNVPDILPGESPFHLTMVHDLYSVQALFGREEPVEFGAQTHRRKNGSVDLALAQLKWADGRVAAFAAGFVAPPGMPGDGFDRLEVYGDNWAAKIDTNPRPMQVWDDRARWPMELEICADPVAPTGMLAEQMRCFCRVVRGNIAVPSGATYHDAMQVQGWLDKLTEITGGH